MAKTQFNVEQFKTEAVKPLFAVAGATELAVELARGYATEAQQATQKRFDEVQARVTDVQSRVQKVDFDTKSLQAQAKTRVEQLQADAKDAQARFEARITELQKDAKDFPAKFEARLNDALEELNSTYAELQARGEKFVAAVRKDGIKAVTAVKPARKRKPAAKKAPATKTAAKMAPAMKAPAMKGAAMKASLRLADEVPRACGTGDFAVSKPCTTDARGAVVLGLATCTRLISSQASWECSSWCLPSSRPGRSSTPWRGRRLPSPLPTS
jgi:hypothetical protein